MQIKIHSTGKDSPRMGLRYKIASVTILFFSMVWCGLFLSVPFLLKGNLTLQKIAALIRFFFAPICHQMDSRSFHLAGHALPVCARCTGIYGGFLVGILIYILISRLKKVLVPSRATLLIGLTVTGLEVSLSLLNVFPSTLASRSITGAVLGFIAAFFVMAALNQIINRPIKNEVKVWKELPVS